MRRRPHEHSFEARGVHQISVYSDGAKVDANGNERMPSERYTDVLYVCDGCGEAKTKRLDGHWKLGQLLRQRPAAKGFESPWRGYGRDGIQTR